MGGPILLGGDDLPSPVRIGLTDLPNIGGAMAPPAPPVPASLYTINFIILGESREKRTKKQKKTKLAGQPKRNMSSYMIWMNANRDKIKKDNPGFTIGDVAKKAGELWKALSDKSVSTYLPRFDLFQHRTKTTQILREQISLK